MTISDDESEKNRATTASMVDLKTMEKSLKSSMDVKFDEMRDLIMKLSNGTAPSETITPLEDSGNSNDGETEEEKEKKKGRKEKNGRSSIYTSFFHSL